MILGGPAGRLQIVMGRVGWRRRGSGRRRTWWVWQLGRRDFEMMNRTIYSSKKLIIDIVCCNSIV